MYAYVYLYPCASIIIVHLDYSASVLDVGTTVTTDSFGHDREPRMSERHSDECGNCITAHFILGSCSASEVAVLCFFPGARDQMSDIE